MHKVADTDHRGIARTAHPCRAAERVGRVGREAVNRLLRHGSGIAPASKVAVPRLLAHDAVARGLRPAGERAGLEGAIVDDARAVDLEIIEPCVPIARGLIP